MKEFAGQKGEFKAWVTGTIANLNHKAGHYVHLSTAKLNALDWKIIREIYDTYKLELRKGRTKIYI
ncbi:hypothetical protein CAL7716_059110 [Calothrix sp. PCC 7716]|nr:hypothetical protein CAL7716_059110 [Calothrix sp. PCC 7716]